MDLRSNSTSPKESSNVHNVNIPKELWVRDPEVLGKKRTEGWLNFQSLFTLQGNSISIQTRTKMIEKNYYLLPLQCQVQSAVAEGAVVAFVAVAAFEAEDIRPPTLCRWNRRDNACSSGRRRDRRTRSRRRKTF